MPLTPPQIESADGAILMYWDDDFSSWLPATCWVRLCEGGGVLNLCRMTLTMATRST